MTQQFWDDNYVVYDISNVNPSASCSTNVNDAIVYIVKEGKIPKGRKCEAFINKVRIPGGDISGVPDLPDGLSDTVSLNTLFSDVMR